MHSKAVWSVIDFLANETRQEVKVNEAFFGGVKVPEALFHYG